MNISAQMEVFKEKKNKTLDVYGFTEKFYQASKFYQEFIS